MNRVLFALLAVCAAASVDGLGKGLKVRFGVELWGNNFFIDLPETLAEAAREGWIQSSRPDATLPSLQLLCHGSYIVCLLFEHDTGFVGGIQISLPADEVTEATFDWAKRGFVPWRPADGVNYWSNQQYFVTEEYLAIDPEERLANRDYEKTLQLDGVWVHGIDRELVHIPIAGDGIVANGFTKQACVPLMGQHYFYNMTAELPCSSETLLSWFALTHHDNLVASGLVTFGKFPEAEKDFFERPPELAVRVINPRAPDCLYELAGRVGLITMHIYYINSPSRLLCII